MISIDAILATKIFIIHIKILHQTTLAPMRYDIHRLPMGGKIPLAPDDLWGDSARLGQRHASCQTHSAAPQSQVVRRGFCQVQSRRDILARQHARVIKMARWVSPLQMKGSSAFRSQDRRQSPVRPSPAHLPTPPRWSIGYRPMASLWLTFV
jgi:hypothetical protein